MNNILPEINLSLEKRSDELIAHLIFFNNSDNDLFLDRPTICLGIELQRNLFCVLEQKKRLEYVGRMVKRDVEAKDFIVLKSGQKRETSVFLNEGYQLKKGRKYSVQYVAFNPPYLKIQDLMKMESNKVDIFY